MNPLTYIAKSFWSALLKGTAVGASLFLIGLVARLLVLCLQGGWHFIETLTGQ